MKYALFLSLLTLSLPVAAETLVLVDKPLDSPTAESRVFPPEPSERFSYIDGSIGAWSDSGKIRLTYDGGFGVKSTGGLNAEIVTAADKYYSISVNNITLRGISGDALTARQIESLVFTADIRMPAGRRIELQLMPMLPDDMKRQAYPSRIVLANLVGTGDFVRVNLTGAKANQKSREAFLGAFRTAALNGRNEVVFHISLHLDAGWQVGDTLQIDNLKLTLER